MCLAYIHRVVQQMFITSQVKISQKYKEVILPPWDYIVSLLDCIVFSNVDDNY